MNGEKEATRASMAARGRALLVLFADLTFLGPRGEGPSAAVPGAVPRTPSHSTSGPSAAAAVGEII